MRTLHRRFNIPSIFNWSKYHTFNNTLKSRSSTIKLSEENLLYSKKLSFPQRFYDKSQLSSHSKNEYFEIKHNLKSPYVENDWYNIVTIQNTFKQLNNKSLWQIKGGVLI